MEDYTWVILISAPEAEPTAMVFKKGPSGPSRRVHFTEVIRKGEHFRLLAPDGSPRYSGYIVGDYRGLEPLEDYGRQRGCTRIQYERNEG